MSTKAKIITTAIILVLLGSVFALLQSQDKPATPTPHEGRVTEEQVTQGVQSDNPASPTASNYRSTSQVSVSLSSPVEGQQFGPSTNQISIRAVLNGITSGTCTVVLSKANSVSITESAPVTAAPTYYTCQGFDIPKSRFNSPGQWKLKLSVKSERAEGSSEERTITVN